MRSLDSVTSHAHFAPLPFKRGPWQKTTRWLLLEKTWRPTDTKSKAYLLIFNWPADGLCENKAAETTTTFGFCSLTRNRSSEKWRSKTNYRAVRSRFVTQTQHFSINWPYWASLVFINDFRRPSHQFNSATHYTSAVLVATSVILRIFTFISQSKDLSISFKLDLDFVYFFEWLFRQTANGHG